MTVRNILKVYNQATGCERLNGASWYREAQGQANAISERLKLPLHIVTGVIAALSPNNKWDRNVINAEALCQAYLDGQSIDSVKVSTYSAMKAKAWSILSNALATVDQVIKTLNGQKIIAFFRCILGDNTCCVDGHAFNIWRNERVSLTSDKTNVGVKLYRTIAADYTKAAKKLGLTAYEVQAITWVAWRRIHGIK
jgi:hypothetical protein